MAGAIRKWSWLLLIPLALFGIPFLLFATMIGSRLLSILIGPVNIFNMTTRPPSASDVAGQYVLTDSSRQPSGAKIPKRSGFRLGADHSVEVTDLPSFGDFGKQFDCTYNGTGAWSMDGDGEVRLSINISDASPRSCGPIDLSVFHLLGHSAPYRVWYNIGDPDNDQGLIYARQVR